MHISEDLDARTERLQQTTASQPMDFDAHYQLGLTQQQRGLAQAALAPLQRALLIKPGNTLVRKALGIALLDCGEYIEAAQVLGDAHRDAPGDPEICGQLGILAEVFNNREEALGWYRSALAIDPHSGEAWQALARLKTWTTEDHDLRDLQVAVAAATIPMELNYALGKAWGDLGDYDRAMDCYHSANTAQAAQQEYNAQAQADFFARHQSLTAEALKPHAAEAGDLHAPAPLAGASARARRAGS